MMVWLPAEAPPVFQVAFPDGAPISYMIPPSTLNRMARTPVSHEALPEMVIDAPICCGEDGLADREVMEQEGF